MNLIDNKIHTSELFWFHILVASTIQICLLLLPEEFRLVVPSSIIIIFPFSNKYSVMIRRGIYQISRLACSIA